MATEFAAFSAIVAPDEKVFGYLEGRRYAPSGDMWRDALASWRDLRSDDDAAFDIEHSIAAGDVGPLVTCGVRPQQANALDEEVLDLEAVPGGPHRDLTARAPAYMELPPVNPRPAPPVAAASL